MTSQMRVESIQYSVKVQREVKSQKEKAKLTRTLILKSQDNNALRLRCQISTEPNRSMRIRYS